MTLTWASQSAIAWSGSNTSVTANARSPNPKPSPRLIAGPAMAIWNSVGDDLARGSYA
jgi:hypothetical protein